MNEIPTRNSFGSTTSGDFAVSQHGIFHHCDATEKRPHRQRQHPARRILGRSHTPRGPERRELNRLLQPEAMVEPNRLTPSTHAAQTKAHAP